MEQDTRVIEQLLSSLIQVIGRAVFPPEKVLESVGRSRMQLRAFNMCDGNRTQSEIAKKLRTDQGNLSRTSMRWIEKGIAFPVGDGKNARLGNQMSGRRLIEVAFPPKEATLDSLHEKKVHHGHISTLHIWPPPLPVARRRRDK